jgi:hypothetical protein
MTMNIRTSIAMNMLTKGNRRCTIMSIRASTGLMIIIIPDMRRKSTDIRGTRNRSNKLCEVIGPGFFVALVAYLFIS